MTAVGTGNCRITAYDNNDGYLQSYLDITVSVNSEQPGEDESTLPVLEGTGDLYFTYNDGAYSTQSNITCENRPDDMTHVLIRATMSDDTVKEYIVDAIIDTTGFWYGTQLEANETGPFIKEVDKTLIIIKDNIKIAKCNVTGEVYITNGKYGSPLYVEPTYSQILVDETLQLEVTSYGQPYDNVTYSISGTAGGAGSNSIELSDTGLIKGVALGGCYVRVTDKTDTNISKEVTVWVVEEKSV